MRIIKKNRITLELFSSQSFFSDLTLAFLLDLTSFLFFITISTISTIVFIYSKFYINLTLAQKSTNNRFILVLFSFILSIFILVFSGSWISLILGWDGLGLSSFLLVIFYNNAKRLRGGLLTFLINRIGDAFFILSFININYFGWIFIEFLNFSHSSYFLLLIILGTITKRAQYPFSSWLPAAIAAPTPVSSLVHSSTLVTAGVYVLIRFNFLLNKIFFFLRIISLATIVIRGLRASLELDFKKIIAISTLRQLGFITFSLSLGLWNLAFFHVLFHAFFKSRLFLSTGGVIHQFYRNQDSRLYGNSQSSLLAKLFFITTCLRLIGFPLTLGFFSKDRILSLASSLHSNLIQWAFNLGCTLTVAYSLRILFLSLNKNLYSLVTLNITEEKNFYTPILFLVLLNIYCGNYFFIEYFYLEFTSFIDCFLGVIIITFGSLINFLKIKNYFKYNFFITISFLSRFFSNPFNKLNKFITPSIETTWGEISTGLGILNLTKISLNSINSSFNLHIFPISLFILILLIL